MALGVALGRLQFDLSVNLAIILIHLESLAEGIIASTLLGYLQLSKFSGEVIVICSRVRKLLVGRRFTWFEDFRALVVLC